MLAAADQRWEDRMAAEKHMWRMGQELASFLLFEVGLAVAGEDIDCSSPFVARRQGSQRQKAGCCTVHTAVEADHMNTLTVVVHRTLGVHFQCRSSQLCQRQGVDLMLLKDT